MYWLTLKHANGHILQMRILRHSTWATCSRLLSWWGCWMACWIEWCSISSAGTLSLDALLLLFWLRNGGSPLLLGDVIEPSICSEYQGRSIVILNGDSEKPFVFEPWTQKDSWKYECEDDYVFYGQGWYYIFLKYSSKPLFEPVLGWNYYY